MKIRILRVCGEGAQVVVAFDCALGSGLGRWHGTPPMAGDTRWVELDCGEVLRPGANVVRVEASDVEMQVVDGGVQLMGPLVRVIDRVVVLGLGDTQISFEASGAVDFWKVDKTYLVSIQGLDVYDQSL